MRKVIERVAKPPRTTNASVESRSERVGGIELSDDPEQVALTRLVAREPTDAEYHLRRAASAVRDGSRDDAYAAAVDAFVALPAEAESPRRQILTLVRPLLASSQVAELTEVHRGSALAGDALRHVPFSVLTTGAEGTTVVVGAESRSPVIATQRAVSTSDQSEEAVDRAVRTAADEPGRSRLRARALIGTLVALLLVVVGGSVLVDLWSDGPAPDEGTDDFVRTTGANPSPTGGAPAADGGEIPVPPPGAPVPLELDRNGFATAGPQLVEHLVRLLAEPGQASVDDVMAPGSQGHQDLSALLQGLVADGEVVELEGVTVEPLGPPVVGQDRVQLEIVVDWTEGVFRDAETGTVTRREPGPAEGLPVRITLVRVGETWLVSTTEFLTDRGATGIG